MTSKRLRAVGCALVLAVVAVAVGWPAPASAAALKVNDPMFNRQWGLRRIGAPQAWKTTQGKGTIIAIVDTGVSKRHEDLAANFLTSKQYDAINDDFDAADLQGHGTSVAGVAAAVGNNRKGIAGAAPKAKIMAIRAFGAIARADAADVADGIMWAADNGADVINLSLGAEIEEFVGHRPDPQIQEAAAVLYAMSRGSLVVAAAGNGGSDRQGNAMCGLPAANPAALCVGASDELDRLADFSNFGVRLDVVAPGTSIVSTDKFGFYRSSQGTSVAAPFVAGVGALLMSMGATNVQAAHIIRTTAKDLGLPGYDITYGFGRLDAAAAVALCSQIC